jgi:hypothetical protein
MGTEVTIEQRLEQLEQSNKRLKAVLLALGTVAIAGAILGATVPAPKVITGERFVLLDAAGNQRAELSANTKSAALQFLNSDGTRALVLAAGSSGNGIFLTDKKGNDRASLFTSDEGTVNFAITKPGANRDVFLITDNPKGTVLAVRDPSGKERIDLGYSEKGASLVIADGNETTRSMIAEQGVVTFKKGGQLEWASFGADLTPEERRRVNDLINGVIPK